MSKESQTKPSAGNPGPLKHPGQEEWMAFLYGETPRSARRALAGHLAGCPDCQQQVQGWRTAMRSLNEWQAPRKIAFAGAAPSLVKWGVAAMLVLGVGFAFGRFAAPAAPSAETLRAAMTPALNSYLQTAVEQRLKEVLAGDWRTNMLEARAQLAGDTPQQNRDQMDRFGNALLAAARSDTQRLLARFALAYERERQQEYQTILTSLRQMESRQASDYTFLRKDLETLALTTETAIDRSQRQIGKLAAYTEPFQNQSRGLKSLPPGEPASTQQP
jgi:hypothetical protein